MYFVFFDCESRIAIALGLHEWFTRLSTAFSELNVLADQNNRASRDFLWITLSVFVGNFFAKIFNLCGRRRCGGGPPGGGARDGGERAPQIENFRKFEFLAPKTLVRNWSERSPNASRTDPKRIPNGSRTDPEWTPKGPRMTYWVLSGHINPSDLLDSATRLRC